MNKAQDQLRKMKQVQDASDDDLDTDLIDSTKKRFNKYGPAATEVTDSDSDNIEETKESTKTLLWILGGFVAICLIFILVLVLTKPSHEVLTVDELHALNLEGKLDPDQGYLYNGFSFVKFSGIWYSQLSKGNTVYDVTFNTDPRSVEDIPVEGLLSENFRQGYKLYITFDPDAVSTKYITVANAGLSMGLVKAFGYELTAGCTDNESMICQNSGVITCDDPDKAVIYFKEAEETKIILDDNCVTIQGFGPDIVRAKDRLLFRWYGMME